MAAPTISVCVPTYNGAGFLGETLASIEAQTFGDFEVVIVDDGSTDDTLSIASAYAARDPRVRVIRNAERAGSSARNANNCVDHARGEWIKFLFQDDLMAPECLARLLQAGTRGSLVFAWHDYVFADDVDREARQYYETLPTLRSTLPPTGATADEFCRAMLRHWYANFIGPTSSSFIHRSCFERYGRFDGHNRSFPDLDYWIRIGNAQGISIEPEYLVTFRVHGTSISATQRRAPGHAFSHDVEELALMLNIARDPAYAGIKRQAGQTPITLDVERELLVCARATRWVAEDAKYRIGDDKPMAEWNAFCARHPEMVDVLRSVDASSTVWERLRRAMKRRLRTR